MGEYWVTNVKIDKDQIDEVKAYVNTIEGLTNPVKYTKDEIVESIQDKNDKWYTGVLKEKKGSRNIWRRDSKIQVVDVEGEKFIRTDKNKKKSDDLGNLPSL